MLCFRRGFAGFSTGVVLLTISGLSAQNRPVYRFGTDYRLEDAAQELGISPARLRQAREALRKATEDIDIITSRSQGVVRPIVHLWSRIDADSASAAFLFLLNQVREDAVAARGDHVYKWTVMLAADLLNPLADADLNLALHLADAWPRPPEGLTEESWECYRYLRSGIVRERLLQIASQDPDHALEVLLELKPALTFAVRGEIAKRYFSQGREDEAEVLVRQCIREFEAMRVNSETYLDFASLLSKLGFSDDLFLRAFAPAVHKSYPLGDVQARWAVTPDGDDVIVTHQENVLMWTLLFIRKRPAVVDEALRMAGLYERIQSMGGQPAMVRRQYKERPPVFPAASVVNVPSVPMGSASSAAGAGPSVHAGRIHYTLETDWEAETMAVLTGRVPLTQRAQRLYQLLLRQRGKDLRPGLRYGAEGVLDLLRNDVVTHVDFSGDYFNDDGVPAVGMEWLLLPLWADYDFDDAMRRVAEHPHRNYRQIVYRKIAYHLAQPVIAR